jgi:hypothetical protein
MTTPETAIGVNATIEERKIKKRMMMRGRGGGGGGGIGKR